MYNIMYWVHAKEDFVNFLMNFFPWDEFWNPFDKIGVSLIMNYKCGQMVSLVNRSINPAGKTQWPRKIFILD